MRQIPDLHRAVVVVDLRYLSLKPILVFSVTNTRLLLPYALRRDPWRNDRLDESS